LNLAKTPRIAGISFVIPLATGDRTACDAWFCPCSILPLDGSPNLEEALLLGEDRES
jgi:hypothetical protein